MFCRFCVKFGAHWRPKAVASEWSAPKNPTDPTDPITNPQVDRLGNHSKGAPSYPCLLTTLVYQIPRISLKK